MPHLRCARLSDLDAINAIQSQAFTHAFQESGLAEARVPLCHQRFLQMYLASNPEGSFVFERDGRVIAYCFSHLWGKVSWLGPLSVAVSEQGKGVGKKIVQATVTHLKSQGAATIGLELSASSCKNIAFYSGLDFAPELLAVDLVREVSSQPAELPTGFRAIYHSQFSESEADFLTSANQLWEASQPGLNYEQEMKNALKFEFGDSLLLLRNEKPVAFVVAHTQPYSSEERRFFLKTSVLHVTPDDGWQVFQSLLIALEKWAANADLGALYIRAWTRHRSAFAWLLSQGFKAVNNEMRMTLLGYGVPENFGDINFSKWE